MWCPKQNTEQKKAFQEPEGTHTETYMQIFIAPLFIITKIPTID